ncbi:MAG: aminoglycoside phosphotransferase family protein [Vicinamibacterales bacterium]
MSDPRIESYLHDAGLADQVSAVIALTGDASDRKYFRVLLNDSRTIVLALHVEPITFQTLPFANVCALLQRMPLPVPGILGHADALGIVALEDLGDVTLQAHLGAATPTEHAALYREAVALIEQLQRRGADLASERYLPYTLAFDVDKLTWELRFFVKHFLEGYRGAVLSPAEREALDEEWAAITRELAAEPQVLCHRDYHSRNLMVHGGRLHIIDFQDARLGPDTYDLVSLLRDSYVDLPDAQVEDLIAYFLALKKCTDAPEFRRRFDVMALQRNLKALGTFGFQTISRRNPVYLQYVPRTLHYVRANISRHNRFGRLRALLAPHLDELR